MPSLAKELDPSSWTMCPAEAVKLDLLTVLLIQLAFITVPTLKMLAFDVETVSWHQWRTVGNSSYRAKITLL